MKFTDSPVIDLQILDSHLTVHQDNNSMHVGTSVWPCSLVLVKFAERWHLLNSSSSSSAANNPYAELLNFNNKRGIELGAGCGPTSMGLYLLGLTDIVVTDIAPVLPALKHNLKRNKPVLKKNLKTAQLYWANQAQMRALGPPFDIVVAADVVYMEESVGPLVETMEKMVADDGVVLFGYQVRSPEAHKLFWELCEGVFDVEKIPHEDLHLDYAYAETDVYVFRKKKKKDKDGNKVKQ